MIEWLEISMPFSVNSDALYKCAKKDLSDGLGLVDFPLG